MRPLVKFMKKEKTEMMTTMTSFCFSSRFNLFRSIYERFFLIKLLHNNISNEAYYYHGRECHNLAKILYH